MDIFLHSSLHHFYAEHPIVLVDVGARGGLKKDWQSARRFLRTIAFEPDAQEFEKLADRSKTTEDRVLGTALAETDGTIPLNVTRDAGLSSVYEPNRAWLEQFPSVNRFDVVDRRAVTARRLDAVLAEQGEHDVDFIKVDTQGSELGILRGARDVLGRSIIGLEVEVEFAPIYSGQPLFGDVDGYLRECGFDLFDLRPCYWKRARGAALGGPYGQMIWADALYLRRSEDLPALAGRLQGDSATAKMLKAITIALNFGYCDLAVEWTRAGSGTLNADQRLAAEQSIHAHSQGVRRLPSFPGKRGLAALARRASRWLADPGDWAIGEGRIGNDRR